MADRSPWRWSMGPCPWLIDPWARGRCVVDVMMVSVAAAHGGHCGWGHAHGDALSVVAPRPQHPRPDGQTDSRTVGQSARVEAVVANVFEPNNKHSWFSGIITACHAVDPGSIPGLCILLLLAFHCFCSDRDAGGLGAKGRQGPWPWAPTALFFQVEYRVSLLCVGELMAASTTTGRPCQNRQSEKGRRGMAKKSKRKTAVFVV
jgi:hypothetical protein